LPYAINNHIDQAELGVADIERVKVDTQSGVRLGIGTLLPCFDCWYLLAEWTHLNSSGKDSQSGSDLTPIWSDKVGNPIVSRAAAEYQFKLNIADFTLAKSYCVRNKLELRPSVGIRGTWIDQDLDVLYSGGNLSEPLLSKNSIDYKGWGIRTGLTTTWNLCNGFSFLGWSHVDILWSRFDVEQKGLQQSGELRSAISDTICTMTPVLELFFGIAWEQMFCGCTRVQARFGWEEQYFFNGVQFNQNTLTAGIDDRNIVHQLGGLGIGGLTAGVSIGF